MKVIVLIGIPGSGKSTFCEKYPSYVRINQDILGSREACLSVFRSSMLEKKSVIIDRCNINKMQRSIWIKEASKFDVKEINAIYLKVTPEECIKRINNRDNHPTINKNNVEKNKEIVYNFLKSFEMPEIEEGFNKVLFIKNE